MCHVLISPFFFFLLFLVQKDSSGLPNSSLLCFITPNICAGVCQQGVGGAPAGTRGAMVGGPYFPFDSGLIFQLLQQLPRSQTLGYLSSPTVGARWV